METETEDNRIDPFLEIVLDKAERFSETGKALLSLKFQEETERGISKLIPRIYLAIFICAFAVSLSISLGLWLGELLGKNGFGFMIVAAVYGLSGIVFYLFHPYFRKQNTGERDLKGRIQELELKQSGQWLDLKKQIHTEFDRSKSDRSKPVPFNALNTAIGLTAGIAARKLLVGSTINPLRKLLGVLIEVAVANKTAKNGDGIKSLAGVLLNSFIQPKFKN